MQNIKKKLLINVPAGREAANTCGTEHPVLRGCPGVVFPSIPKTAHSINGMMPRATASEML